MRRPAPLLVRAPEPPRLAPPENPPRPADGREERSPEKLPLRLDEDDGRELLPLRPRLRLLLLGRASN